LAIEGVQDQSNQFVFPAGRFPCQKGECIEKLASKALNSNVPLPIDIQKWSAASILILNVIHRAHSSLSIGRFNETRKKSECPINILKTSILTELVMNLGISGSKSNGKMSEQKNIQPQRISFILILIKINLMKIKETDERRNKLVIRSGQNMYCFLNLAHPLI
jgi:hypothetical protein